MASLSGYVNPEWLDEKFVERALREGEADPDIVVKHIQAKAATAVGDNYASLMYRVSVEFVRWGGKIEKQSLIVKALPQSESMKNLITGCELFLIESNMFKKTLPDMEKLLKGADEEKYKPFSARGIYFAPQPEETLVLEDLSVSGFKVAERQKGLDLEHSMLAIQRLAMFHAASVVLAEKDPMSMAPYYADFITKSKEVEKFYSTTVLSFAEEVNTWPEYSEKYAQKLIKLSKTLYSVTFEKRKRFEGDFNVLNHGDTWLNNMMFSYTENGKIKDHRFVDFQLAYYGSPAIDLHYMLATTPSPFVKVNHNEDLLLEYYSTLCETLKDLKYTGKIPSYIELKRDLESKQSFSVFAAISVLPLVLSDPGSSNNIEDILGDKNSGENHKSSMRYSDTYITELKRLLPIFEKNGIFV